MSNGFVVPQYQAYNQQAVTAPNAHFDEYYDDDDENDDNLDNIANPMDMFNQNDDDNVDVDDDDPNNPFNDDDDDDEEDDDIAGIIANTAALKVDGAPPTSLFGTTNFRSAVPGPTPQYRPAGNATFQQGAATPPGAMFQQRAPMPIPPGAIFQQGAATPPGAMFQQRAPIAMPMPMPPTAMFQQRAPIAMPMPMPPTAMFQQRAPIAMPPGAMFQQRAPIPTAALAVSKVNAPRLVISNATRYVPPVFTGSSEQLSILSGASGTPIPGASSAAVLAVSIPNGVQTERHTLQLANIEQLLAKMPGLYTSVPVGFINTDINDLLKQDVDESSDDFEARRRLTLQLAVIPDYSLNPVAATTIGQMMMKKARQGITYDTDMENALTYITALLQR